MEAEKRKALTEQLNATKTLLERTRFILKTTQENESKLTKEALSVVSVLRDSIVDGDRLHGKLIDHASMEKQTRAIARKFRECTSGILTGLSGNCYELR